jgi:hypothetical protein
MQALFLYYGTIGVLNAGAWSFGHSGGSPGVSAAFQMHPERDWFVSVLANYDSDTPIMGEANRLIDGS